MLPKPRFGKDRKSNLSIASQGRFKELSGTLTEPFIQLTNQVESLWEQVETLSSAVVELRGENETLRGQIADFEPEIGEDTQRPGKSPLPPGQAQSGSLTDSKSDTLQESRRTNVARVQGIEMLPTAVGARVLESIARNERVLVHYERNQERDRWTVQTGSLPLETSDGDIADLKEDPRIRLYPDNLIHHPKTRSGFDKVLLRHQQLRHDWLSQLSAGTTLGTWKKELEEERHLIDLLLNRDLVRMSADAATVFIEKMDRTTRNILAGKAYATSRSL